MSVPPTPHCSPARLETYWIPRLLIMETWSLPKQWDLWPKQQRRNSLAVFCWCDIKLLPPWCLPSVETVPITECTLMYMATSSHTEEMLSRLFNLRFFAPVLSLTGLLIVPSLLLRSKHFSYRDASASFSFLSAWGTHNAHINSGCINPRVFHGTPCLCSVKQML